MLLNLTQQLNHLRWCLHLDRGARILQHLATQSHHHREIRSKVTWLLGTELGPSSLRFRESFFQCFRKVIIRRQSLVDRFVRWDTCFDSPLDPRDDPAKKSPLLFAKKNCFGLGVDSIGNNTKSSTARTRRNRIANKRQGSATSNPEQASREYCLAMLVIANGENWIRCHATNPTKANATTGTKLDKMQTPPRHTRLRSFTGMLKKLAQLLRLSIDLDADELVKEARRWNHQRERASTDEDSLALSKEAYEYGLKTFEDALDAYRTTANDAITAIRHNAYLVAIVFGFFETQADAHPIWVKLALACWVVAMLLMATIARRTFRPTGLELSAAQDFIDSGDRRFHAYMNGTLNIAIVQMRVITNHRAHVFNFGLGFTIAGLVLLVVGITTL